MSGHLNLNRHSNSLNSVSDSFLLVLEESEVDDDLFEEPIEENLEKVKEIIKEPEERWVLFQLRKYCTKKYISKFSVIYQHILTLNKIVSNQN